MELYDADIALLHLSEPVQLTDRIRPICLPSSFDDDYSYSADESEPNDVGIIIGWGRLHEFSYSAPALQEAYVPLVDHQTCQDANTYTITSHMICAGFDQGMAKGEERIERQYYYVQYSNNDNYYQQRTNCLKHRMLTFACACFPSKQI